MRKHKKQNRLLSLTLCICLVMAFMPVTAFAADFNVTVNKVAVTNANADNVLGDGTVSYDAVKDTLTLKNATIEARSTDAISSSKDDLTILLEGNNTIESDWYGIISTTGTVTFKGEGSLTLRTGNDAIRAAEIVVDGTTLNIQQTEYCGLYATKDYKSDKGSVRISNGSNITLGCKSFAIYADGAAGVFISGSNVTATGEYSTNVIYAQGGPLSVTNSKVTAENTGLNTSPTIWATGISISDNSEVSAKIGGEAPAVYSPATLIVKDSSLKAESPVGVWSDSSMSIEDSTIETTCTGGTVTNSLHSLDTISIKGNSDVLAIGGVMGNNGVIVAPSAGNKVDVKVGTKENGETGAKHFKDSPYTAAVTFASSDNEELKGYTYVHIQNHTHVYDQQAVSDGYQASHATCTEPAQYYTSCVCGVSSAGTHLEATFTVGQATGHSFGTDWKFNNTSHWHECTKGDGAKTDTAAHISDGGRVTIAATQTEKGVKTYSCTVCGYVLKTEEIPIFAHTHSFGPEWKSDSTRHWHECTAGDGARSGEALHTAGDWIVDQSATENEAGSRHKECMVCKYVMQTEPIAPTGPSHTWRTLTDPSGVRVSGLFTSDAKLEVKEMLLHLQGDCDVCDNIRRRQKNGELIALFDIGLKTGKYKGGLDVEIPVGKPYNGQSVLMIHCMNKVMDSRTLTVSGGYAKGTVTSLSPFAVAKVPAGAAVTGLPERYTLLSGQTVSWTPQPAGGSWSYDKDLLEMTRQGDTYTFKAFKEGKATATYTVDGVPHTVTITIDSSTNPQTGDVSNPWPWALLTTAALLGCAGLPIYGKRSKKA